MFGAEENASMCLVRLAPIKRLLLFGFLLITALSLVSETLPQPTTQNLFPAEGQGNVSINPTLEIACTTDGIVAAQYTIALEPGFSTVVYDSGEHINDVCSHVAFADLDKDLLHYWRARVKDSTGTWSAWSQATSFITTDSPSVFINIFQDGMLGYSGTRDADIRGNAQDPTGPPIREWNQGIQEVLRTGRRAPRKSTDEIYRSLLKFDLSSLTNPSAVLNAYLELTGTQHGDANENVVFNASNSLYEMLRPWGEGTGLTRAPKQGEVSWTYTALPTTWAIPGAGYASDSDPNADYVATPLIRKIVTNQPGYGTVWSSEAFVALVKKWIERPDLNQGLLLRADDELLHYPFVFAAREYPDVLFRPRLVVELTEEDQAPSNLPPVAVNDAASTDTGVAISLAVLSNDSDPDAQPALLTIANVGLPSHGTAQISSTQILYTPQASFAGVDIFSYTITDGVAMATATVTVTVNAVLSPPTIMSFTALPNPMIAGGSTTLSWNTTNTVSVTIAPNGGSGLSANGSLSVNPAVETTYTLTATGPGGTATATTTVTIAPPVSPLPTISSFIATPEELVAGDTTMLSWSTTDANSVTVTPGSGAILSPSSTLSVSPTVTTSYTLTATGPGGTATATVIVTVTGSPGSSSSRVMQGLVAYYPFTEGAGTTVADQAPTGSPLPLTLTGEVTWLGTANGVVLTDGAAQSSGPATKILTALQATNQSTVEFWVIPSTASQSGPARLLSLRGTTANHATMVGQRGAEAEIWLQHTGKGSKNTPWLKTTTQVFTTTLMHIVHTYDGTVERVYINGVETATQTLHGTYAGWDPTAVLYVGNEDSLDRPWRGTMRLMAIYDHALSPAEIQQNFAAGPAGTNDIAPQNQAPFVNAGADQSVPLSTTLTLTGSVTDDGLPNPPETITVAWTQLSGPGSITFENPAVAYTTATFSAAGTYVLQLAAYDGALSASDEVTVTVTAPSSPAPTIPSFTATPGSVPEGSTTTLAWSTTNTDSVTLSPTGDSGLPATGEFVVTPTQTTTYTLTALGAGGTATATVTVTVTPPSGSGRITSGLVAYYPFTEGTGTTVADQAPTGPPLPLTFIGDVAWSGTTNGVVLTGGALRTSGAATKLHTALQATNQGTVEFWIIPASAWQNGPARLVSLRGATGNYNTMIGQHGDELEVWLQHTGKGSKNKPWLKTSGQAATTTLLHVVHTYNGAVERIYINGVERDSEALSGTFAAWDPTAVFYVGNEASFDRAWQGTLRLLAVYDWALSPTDIQQNFAAGPAGGN
jgi:hypothetical protein